MAVQEEGEAPSFVRTVRYPMRLPDLPPVSGDRFVRVLVASGWMPVEWTEGTCTLAREGRNLVVPRLSALESDVVERLLDAARVLPLAFVTALERLCEKELLILQSVGTRLAG
jgi:hypothetical protein